MPLRSRLERHFHFLVGKSVEVGRFPLLHLRLRLALAHGGLVSPLRICLLGAAASVFTACAGDPSVHAQKRYSLVRVTDYEGRLVAEWIAEGFVAQTPHGYKFRAVERLSGQPLQQELHYPYGRKVEIGGPNIIVSRVGKPLWLYRLEGY